MTEKRCKTCRRYKWLGLSYCTKLLPVGHPNYPAPIPITETNPPEWCPGHEDKAERRNVNNVPIILSLRLDDSMGDTERREVGAFVTPEGSIVYSDGNTVGNTESNREGNRREIARGKLQAKLNVLNEMVFALDSGVSMETSSPFIRKFARDLLLIRVGKLERAISRITNRKAVTA